MNGKEIIEAWKRGQRVYGTLLVSASPKWAKEILKTGVDFVFIDTEHSPLDRIELSWMCHMFKALNIAPIVRIPSPDPYQACMALDSGAQGIIAPYLETVYEAKKLYGAVKLRPLKGKKLKLVLDGKLQLSSDEIIYLEKFNEGNLLLLNIESQAGIDSLDDILDVLGVDGVIIGPHDLSISLGIPEQYDHPLFDAAVKAIIKKVKSKGVAVGNHYSYGIEKEIEWGMEGMNIILHSSDIVAFTQHITTELESIKATLGDL